MWLELLMHTGDASLLLVKGLRHVGDVSFMKVIIILAGLFSIFCSVKNYDWFIESRKARIFLKLFGRTGTRVFYILLGIAVIVLGILM